MIDTKLVKLSFCNSIKHPMQVLAYIGIALSLSQLGIPPAKAAGQEFLCQAPRYQVHEKPVCNWTKELSQICSSQLKGSIFGLCNVFSLDIGASLELNDEINNSYDAAIFKYSERNECSTGGNDSFSILGKCDTFASYAQIMRNKSTNKCYAFVNSALLGTQLQEYGIRNEIGKYVTKLEIPGISRRIIFTPSVNTDIMNQSGAALIRTKSTPNAEKSGQAVSSLYLLELESPLTVKPANLKPNPAKIRISRGLGAAKDYLDIPLGRREEEALNKILSECS